MAKSKPKAKRPTDTERLDWIQKRRAWVTCEHYQSPTPGWHVDWDSGPSLKETDEYTSARAAIDAAMREARRG